MTHKFFILAASLAFAYALTLTPARADDEHHGRALDARQHGYEHGYRDGYSAGLDAKEHGNRLNTSGGDADRGYHDSFGSKDSYKDGYREGYRVGAEDAYSGSRTRLEQLFTPDFNPDRGTNWAPGDVASDIGYRDGINAGVKDFRDGHKYKPEDHDAYKDGDRGYDSKYGSKDVYKQQYRAGFQQGYRAGFGIPGRG